MTRQAVERTRQATLLALEAISSGALWMIVILFAGGALERNLIGTSYIGNANDVVGYLAAMLFAFGLAVALARGAHVKIDIFYAAYSQAARFVVDKFFKLLGILAGGILVLGASALCLESYDRGRMVYGVIELPAWIPQALIVLGTLAFLLEFIFGEEQADDHLVTI